MNGLPRRVVLVAVQVDRHAGVVVQRSEQVRIVAPVFEMRQAPRRIRAAGNRVDPAHALDAGDQVHEQVAAHALPVIGKAAPAEEAHRVERPIRRIANPGLPIDGFGAGIGSDRIHPRARRRVAVRVPFNVSHLAQPARLVDLRSLLVHDVAHALAARLEDALALLHRCNHGHPISHVVRHRLLAIDVLARSEAIQNHMLVLKIGNRHDHGVHIFAVEQGTVIPRGGHVCSVGFDSCLLVHVIQVGNRDQLSRGQIARRSQQIAAANPGADRDEADLAVGRAGRRRLRHQGGRLQQRGVHRGSSYGRTCTKAHKIPARNRSVHLRLPACSAILALDTAGCKETLSTNPLQHRSEVRAGLLHFTPDATIPIDSQVTKPRP